MTKNELLPSDEILEDPTGLLVDDELDWESSYGDDYDGEDDER